ncbi:oxidase [Methylobacterium terrae]|uniref:Oxidase n=1 Tax=Methylobacterium terrae TaxID=2202827 RepID=A0A2U8WSZ0_9HYPH|nr:cytochrome C oxidase subunit IV family protein [Methylobacterium terrae]AWN48571.1 oxidase [Methylobacterium terrae]
MSSKPETPGALWRRNLPVWAALMALLGVSTWAAYWPFGRVDTALGFAIAGVKTALVALVFMQLRHAGGLVRLVAACGLFWAAILFTLTLADVLSRMVNR